MVLSEVRLDVDRIHACPPFRQMGVIVGEETMIDASALLPGRPLPGSAIKRVKFNHSTGSGVTRHDEERLKSKLRVQGKRWGDETLLDSWPGLYRGGGSNDHDKEFDRLGINLT